MHPECRHEQRLEYWRQRNARIDDLDTTPPGKTPRIAKAMRDPRRSADMVALVHWAMVATARDRLSVHDAEEAKALERRARLLALLFEAARPDSGRWLSMHYALQTGDPDE